MSDAAAKQRIAAMSDAEKAKVLDGCKPSQIVDVLGEELGEHRAEVNKRFAAMEKAIGARLDAIEQRQQHLDNERSRLMLSVRELRIDLFEELASLKDS